MTDDAQSGWLGELAQSDLPQVVVDSDGALRHVGLAAFRQLGRAPGDAEDLVDLLFARLGGGGRGDRQKAIQLVCRSTGSIVLEAGVTRIILRVQGLRAGLRTVEWSEEFIEDADGELTDSELLAEVLSQVDHGIILYDRDPEGRDVVRLHNQLAEDLLEAPAGFLRRGLRRDEIVRFCVERGDYGAYDASDYLKKVETGDEVRATGRRPSGRYVESRSRARSEGRGSLALNFDVSEDVARLERLVEAEERYRLIAENAPTGIVKLGAAGNVVFANKAATELLGQPIEAIDLFRQLIPSDGLSIEAHLAKSTTFDAEIRRSDDVLHVMVSIAPSRRVRGARIVTLADFTALRVAKLQIEHMAHHDPLTGLGNRSLFSLRWARIEARDVETYPVHLVALDLDRFKLVNDDHGHHVGDLLLATVAERLNAAVRNRGEIFRLGGDEFAVIVSDDSRGVALDMAEEIVLQIGKPFTVDGIVASIGCSAGVASMPLDGTTGIEVQRAADAALYSVKRNGRNGFACYDPSLDEMSDERRLAGDLALALAHDEFDLYFQPTFDIDTGRITRMETLIRWFSRRMNGFVSPGLFLPVAEEAGLIVLIDLWALRRAVQQAKDFQKAGIRRPCLSVNISPTTLSRSGIAERMIETLRNAEIDPSLIEIEMTRSPLQKDMAAVRQTLDAIRAGGMTVALDDFGAAGSGLAILQALPFDRVKLHGSIIEGIGRDEDAEAIASAVLSICRRLGRKLTAEGVETEQQYAALKSIGGTDAQGSLLAPPEPAEAALDRLLRQDGLSRSRGSSLSARKA
ncbi:MULTISPECIES: putative bifunctional diguanylate cyclase/phosphodiesterase [unclassified Aureimonas]|uniref:putative bifunctional diguanylate cyclase/phosphodiesterase n=1 Tax=unclassified Aureimonas TaxID=2615206 RepID=UPI0006F4C0BB|nr:MULTISPECIES: EAL domain-containing protein [unclassified Aureimonas]KQT52918.1 hypothetical protein ASG62_13480 [Aureimonas sp. Leaf427]KQT80377.1 hypothetical protein ASG54_07330 [Aureimonas sp. Leaf460]